MVRIFLIIFSLVFCSTFFVTQPAQARIDILPRKIVMEPRDRSAEITVLNLFDKSGTFRVDIIYYRQNEDGSYTEIDEPLDPNFDPKTAVRYSPRQFVLPPGGRQKIRLSLRKPANLPEGEYRFHVKTLRFAELDEAPQEIQTEGPAVSMKMNIGVSIPVVIRHGGNLNVQAKLSDVTLIPPHQTRDGEHAALQFTINRSGNKGMLGTVRAFWQPKGEDEREIGLVNNMNVFSEITKRKVNLSLREFPQGPGTIRLIYTDDFSNTTFDEIILQQ